MSWSLAIDKINDIVPSSKVQHSSDRMLDIFVGLDMQHNMFNYIIGSNTGSRVSNTSKVSNSPNI